MKNYIEYNSLEHGDPKQYLKGISIWVIASPNSCGSCVIAKSKLEIIRKNYPDVFFVFWDVAKEDINLFVPGLEPLAYPYVRGYVGETCETAAYSAEVYIIEDIIRKLRLEYDNNY